MSDDDIQQRKIYEINQLYQTGDPKLIDIALMLREATKKPMSECVEKNNKILYIPNGCTISYS